MMKLPSPHASCVLLVFAISASLCAALVPLSKRYNVYGYTIVNAYNHDPQAFTEGLLYAGNDTLYESTGLYGASSVRKVHLPTGQVLQVRDVESKYFGEGLVLWDHRLLQLAWKVNLGFIYDQNTLNLIGTFKHPMKDGWGLTTDGKVLYGSDGSSTIFVLEPSTFEAKRSFVVKDQNEQILLLNELEYVHGELWANVWTTDCIVRISPKNGEVLGWILLQKLRKDLLRSNLHIDVLNGIAWDQEKDRVFVTGKEWPKLYEIKVHPYVRNVTHHEDAWKHCKVQKSQD